MLAVFELYHHFSTPISIHIFLWIFSIQKTIFLIHFVKSQVEMINLENVVKLRQGSGKDRQEIALQAKGLRALTLA